jgi:small nuclear ribonucleoprotein (snRNP)-like protein
MEIKDLVGRKVKVIIVLGDVSAPYEGTLKSVDDWIVLETNKGVKFINTDAITLIEEVR